MEREVCSGNEFNAKYGHVVLVKLLNDRENHNEYQFKEGLNVDTILFNTQENCCAGGIYFCKFHDMYTYFTYVSASTDNWKIMKYVREVTVPDDAQVCIEFDYDYDGDGDGDSCPAIKFKADKIILGKRVLIDIFCNPDVQSAREVRINGWKPDSHIMRQKTIIHEFRDFLRSQTAINLLRGIAYKHNTQNNIVNALNNQHKVMDSSTLADKCWLQVLENGRKIEFV